MMARLLMTPERTSVCAVAATQKLKTFASFILSREKAKLSPTEEAMQPIITMIERPEPHMREAIVRPLVAFNNSRASQPESLKRCEARVSVDKCCYRRNRSESSSLSRRLRASRVRCVWHPRRLPAGPETHLCIKPSSTRRPDGAIHRIGTSDFGTKLPIPECPLSVRFSNRPFRVKRFQTIHPTVSMSLTGSCFSTKSAPGALHHGIRGRGGTICWAALPSDER